MTSPPIMGLPVSVEYAAHIMAGSATPTPCRMSAGIAHNLYIDDEAV